MLQAVNERLSCYERILSTSYLTYILDQIILFTKLKDYLVITIKLYSLCLLCSQTQLYRPVAVYRLAVDLNLD